MGKSLDTKVTVAEIQSALALRCPLFNIRVVDGRTPVVANFSSKKWLLWAVCYPCGTGPQWTKTTFSRSVMPSWMKK